MFDPEKYGVSFDKDLQERLKDPKFKNILNIFSKKTLRLLP